MLEDERKISLAIHEQRTKAECNPRQKIHVREWTDHFTKVVAGEVGPILLVIQEKRRNASNHKIEKGKSTRQGPDTE